MSRRETRGLLRGFMTTVLALVVAVSLPALPVLAEDDPLDPPPSEPELFSASGIVVAYDLPGVTTGSEAAADFLATVLDEEEDEDGDENDESGEGDENEGDENEGDENEGDENEGDENEGDENEGDENDGDENDDEYPEVDGPYITLVNDDGEFTFPVAEDFTIEAPVNEDGDYVLNVGDEVEVSGEDGIVDGIIVTPPPLDPDFGPRSLHAAVPGIIAACSATSVVINGHDGLAYTIRVTEDTPVYAGPLLLDISVLSEGDTVVAKGDGMGGAAWIRFIGKSSKTVWNTYRHHHRHHEGAVAVADSDDDGPGGKAKGTAVAAAAKAKSKDKKTVPARKR